MTSDFVLFCSYGNDSIALIQWMAEKGYRDRCAVAYSETGWASDEWGERVVKGECLARGYGFETHRLKPSPPLENGFVSLVRLKKAFPRNGMQFCTGLLKIAPAAEWLEKVDPERDVTCCVGVRREESRSRAKWPEFTPESSAHGGRELWAPLVRVGTADRDSLIRRAGFEPLPHRSKECYPCINANRGDLRLLSEERIRRIEILEGEMGHTSKGKPRTMFRPYRHQGAVGIREVIRWAWSERGKYDPEDGGGCDSGMCGI